MKKLMITALLGGQLLIVGAAGTGRRSRRDPAASRWARSAACACASRWTAIRGSDRSAPASPSRRRCRARNMQGERPLRIGEGVELGFRCGRSFVAVRRRDGRSVVHGSARRQDEDEHGDDGVSTVGWIAIGARRRGPCARRLFFTEAHASDVRMTIRTHMLRSLTSRSTSRGRKFHEELTIAALMAAPDPDRRPRPLAADLRGQQPSKWVRSAACASAFRSAAIRSERQVRAGLTIAPTLQGAEHAKAKDRCGSARASNSAIDPAGPCRCPSPAWTSATAPWRATAG